MDSMIQDAGTQQQEEQQGLAQCYWEWVNDPVAQREYAEWLLKTTHAAWIADYAATLNEPEKEPEMVAFSSMSESKYLKKEDLDENGNLCHIESFKRANVAQEGEDPEFKFTMKLKEFTKPLVLNATNRAVLERTYGSDTDDCIDKPIVLYNDPNISFQGKLVGGIRLRPPKGKGAAKPAPKVADPEDDGEVPF